MLPGSPDGSRWVCLCVHTCACVCMSVYCVCMHVHGVCVYLCICLWICEGVSLCVCVWVCLVFACVPV